MAKEKRSALIRLSLLAGDPSTSRKPNQRPKRAGKTDELYLERQGKHVYRKLNWDPHHEICDKDWQVDIAKIAFRPILTASGKGEVAPLPEKEKRIQRDAQKRRPDALVNCDLAEKRRQIAPAAEHF